MRFAGTWVDNETPQNEHSIEDDHIVSRETCKKKRMTYLMNARITVINDAIPGKMQEGTLNAGDNIITWTSENVKVDPALRMVTSKWYRKQTITSAEFRQQHKDVQKVQEWHASKMSKVEEPKPIAPQREQRQGTASTASEERPAKTYRRIQVVRLGHQAIESQDDPKQHGASVKHVNSNLCQTKKCHKAHILPKL